CPSLLRPVATGDGLLARLPVLGGTLALEAVGGLCVAAQQYGNGTIEVTARGNLQVRGLRVDTQRDFAAAMAAIGLSRPPGVAITCNPLAGLETDAVAD